MGLDRHFTQEELEALPEESRAARDRALEALHLIRHEGLSLTQATDQVGTTRRTMLKYAHWALEKDDSGEWKATPWDRIPRRMRFPTPSGQIVLFVKDSRSAEKVGRYANAVKQFLQTGDASGLKEFRNEVIQVNGKEHEFVTSTRVLRRLARAGEVRFEDLYPTTV